MDLQVDRYIYSDVCVSKAVYALSDRYVINRTVKDNFETVHIVSRSQDKSDEEMRDEFLSVLNDFKLRQIIEIETHDIRIILYAKAFADCEDLNVEDV